MNRRLLWHCRHLRDRFTAWLYYTQPPPPVWRMSYTGACVTFTNVPRPALVKPADHRPEGVLSTDRAGRGTPAVAAASARLAIAAGPWSSIRDTFVQDRLAELIPMLDAA